MLTSAEKEASGKKLQNVFMQLRLACDHPVLFYRPVHRATDEYIINEEVLVNPSGKMLILELMLPALFARGHKVLLFSQFTNMLDILEDWAIGVRDWKVCRIDGAMKQDERREQISTFDNDSGVNLFLLSTRAGGLGINLVAADTVILFDSDWNPQQDLQAQARAHRIGQTKPVIVYRLATANSIEATILDRAEGKRKLEKLVIQKGKFKSLMNASKSGGDRDMEELSNMLLKDETEKFTIKARGDEVISQEDLDRIMDRSQEAYANAADEGPVFKVVETADEGKNSLLSMS